jgi:hypothetical protein
MTFDAIAAAVEATGLRIVGWFHAAEGDGVPEGIATLLAERLGGTALVPFGGPPWHPFQRWAARGEGAVASPVAMQATPGRGLWASYRGAVGFAARLDLPRRLLADPCRGCPAPCLTACPVDAFARGAYDVAGCVAHVIDKAGEACRGGCLVRLSCPAGAALELPRGQRAFHMAAFLAAQAQPGHSRNAAGVCGRDLALMDPSLDPVSESAACER